MQKLITALLLSGVFCAHAESCPQLQGTFHCHSAEPFEVDVAEEMQDGYASYTLSDPTGVRTFLTDGQFHEMNFHDGKGVYKASCQANSLLIEARSPEGEALVDRYYIERAALVRVRQSQNQASSLSCAPTHGTWRLYPH